MLEIQLNLDIIRDDRNQPNQTNKQKTTKEEENIPKRKQYFKEKVLVPPVCLRQADGQLEGNIASHASEVTNGSGLPVTTKKLSASSTDQ